MSKKIVLVTGGTGFTGNYMLRKLCELDYEVRAIKRPTSDISTLGDLDIKWFDGNVYDRDTLKQAMQGVQQIYHLAAAYRTTNLPDIELTNVHLTSTQYLAKFALQQESFERFVLVSTIGVLGHVENPPINEEAPYNPGDLYQSTKADAEKWLIEFAKKNDLPFSIVRPAAIYGPGDRRLLKFFKMAKLPLIPLIGFSKGLYHMIHVEDLVEFIWFTTTKKEALAQVYICGNPRANTLKQMLVTIANHYGKQARFIRIPAGPLFALAKLVDFVSKKLDVEPIIYPRRVAFFTKDRSFDTSKMNALAGFKYKYSEQQGLIQLADWYKAQKWL
ncbi:MAG: NAD-dependent epimerase/dehydratase family protein [Acidiferrobacterales bacterium]|nr:NAD-dependent epimerase/dehydratase family protein [Acidiferrobacterales bacterium]